MTSLATGLPPEVAAAIPSAWRENEKAYWAARPALLATHRGLWVAFADLVVVASGPSAVEVFHAAAASGLHPYVARVGAEDEPCRMRRAAFPYDASYPGEPLPQLAAEFRIAAGISGPVPGLGLPRRAGVHVPAPSRLRRRRADSRPRRAQPRGRAVSWSGR